MIQVSPPNGGSSWGKRTGSVRQSQEVFLTSLTKESRQAADSASGADKSIPPDVQFVCVVGAIGTVGDGVVRTDLTVDGRFAAAGHPGRSAADRRTSRRCARRLSRMPGGTRQRAAAALDHEASRCCTRSDFWERQIGSPHASKRVLFSLAHASGYHRAHIEPRCMTVTGGYAGRCGRRTTGRVGRRSRRSGSRTRKYTIGGRTAAGRSAMGRSPVLSQRGCQRTTGESRLAQESTESTKASGRPARCQTRRGGCSAGGLARTPIIHPKATRGREEIENFYPPQGRAVASRSDP